jgi:hypothetical protein
MARLSRLFPIALIIIFGFAVTPVLAQSTINVDPQQILAQLAPRSGTFLYLDILLYAAFIVGFVTMILVPDKQLMPSMMMLAVLLATLLAKVSIFPLCQLTTLVLNVIIFVFPMIVAGMLRARPGKTAAGVYPAALSGIIGGGYFFLFWALVQSNTAICPTALSAF